ncbi:MAG TPA: protein kinase [Permianibacter sp.]|nr:protein kinase [Permianibacter sp.]
MGLLIAMWIPGYRIVRTLGEGGMATVYLAIQENFQREVAVKIMSPLLARGDASYGERFLREARIVAQLNHPHIVAVYDVGVHDGQHYLAMEYVPGDDLKNRRFQLTLKQALTAVKQVALALEYAHKKGYVHRDIKPENVLLNEDSSRAVLTDFGIARPSGTEGGLTQTGTAIGTPSYMSPEQALGKPLDHRTDLYSLGVVLYYLLVGEVPFTADSAVAVGIKHAVEPVPRLPAALIAFQTTIDKAMAKAADKRFQNGAEFAEAMDALIATLTPELEIAWRQQLKQAEQSSKAPPAAATVISGANPTVLTPTPAPGSAPAATPVATPQRASTPPASDGALTANANDRLGGPGKRAGTRTPPPLVISRPAEKSKLPLVLAIAAVLAAAGGGWYWYQQQSMGPDAASVQPQQTSASRSTTEPAAQQPIPQTPAGATGNELAATDNGGTDTAAATDGAPTDNPVSEAIGTEITAPGNTTSDNTGAGATPETAATDSTTGSETEQTATAPASETAGESTAPEPAADPKQAQITQLLADADKRLKAGKLIEPANDNAEALYSQVLRLDSGNKAAKDGRKNVGIALAKQGMDASKAGDGLRATMLYERAVVLAPKAREVGLLKQRIDAARRAEQAQPYLDKAKKFETAGALITPAENNAYDQYKKAQSIDPASTLALRGLSEIEVRLADEIERLWRKGNVTEASALYAGAKERYPDSKDIADAGKVIVQATTARKPKPADALDTELLRPEILVLRAAGNPLNSIPAEQTTILVIGTSLHAAFTYQNFKAGGTVVEATLYDDTHQIKLGSRKLSLNYDAGELRFQIDRPVEGFPDGDYFLDIHANGERLTSLPFKIQRADLF